MPRSIVICVIWVFMSCNPTVAQRPQIRLDRIFPPGGAAGTDVTVTISGELTEAATDLIFSDPGIDATQQISVATDYATAHRKPKVFDVRVSPDVPDGRYEVRATGPIGLSGPRTFVVSRLKELIFDAAKNSREHPLPMSVGDVVNVTGRPDQRDYFRFPAVKGQEILIQVWAERLDSRFDGELAIYGPDNARVARVRQSQSKDPIFGFEAPDDGEYLVEVWDATYRGGEEYFYRLEVSEHTQVEAIHPVAAQEGVETEFTIYGFNIPGGSVVSGAPGNLQSRQISFAPRFGVASFASALATGSPAAAHINGGSVLLPVPLSTSSIFMARSTIEVTRETANDQMENAQALTLPAEVAGQFFPRRDIDWYQFDAKKGQTYWIEIASNQLGTHADPVLRVAKLSKDANGKLSLSQQAVADDTEAAPGNRNSKRFFTGSVDGHLRFKADDDSQYVVWVSDQYNVSVDDPRLTYRLSIAEDSPDFELVAFAEPERHGDEKIIKPNGVGIAPGGTGLIRVRLLPRHDFAGTVNITAKYLPENVKAHPLTLSRKSPEGTLTLAASPSATSGQSAVDIVGSASLGDRLIKRTARTGIIVRSTNNVDQTPADVRLSNDLIVTVLDAVPEPLSIQPLAALVTSVGAKLKLPVSLTRSETLKDKEIQIEGAQVPKGFKLTAAKTKSSQVEIPTEIQKLIPGVYTVSLSSKLKTRRPRNVTAVREAEADLVKTTSLISLLETTLATEQTVLDRLRFVLKRTIQTIKTSEAELAEPQRQLEQKLAALQKVAEQFAAQLGAAAQDVTDSSLAELADESQAKLNQLRADSQDLRHTLSSSMAPIAALHELQSAQQAEVDRLVNSQGKLNQRLNDARSKHAEFKKLVAERSKNELEKEAEYYVYSTPVRLTVKASPISLRSPKSLTLKQGTATALPISIQRRFGFSGPVTISLQPAGAKSVAASPTVIGAGQSFANLHFEAEADAAVGVRQMTIHAKLKFNNTDIQDQIKVSVEVMPE